MRMSITKELRSSEVFLHACNFLCPSFALERKFFRASESSRSCLCFAFNNKVEIVARMFTQFKIEMASQSSDISICNKSQ